jgi:hypothetical protein
MMRGCAMGCAAQLAWLALGGATAYFATGKTQDRLFAVTIATTWITLIPLVIYERSKGYRTSTGGLVLVGCIALLLGGSCAALLWTPMDFR